MEEIINHLEQNYYIGKDLNPLADPDWGIMILEKESQMFYEFEYPEYLTNELLDFFEDETIIHKAIWEWLRSKGIEPQDWWLEPAECLTKEEVEELKAKNALPKKYTTQISDEQMEEWQRIIDERLK